jgi:hypothetical protein
MDYMGAARTSIWFDIQIDEYGPVHLTFTDSFRQLWFD